MDGVILQCIYWRVGGGLHVNGPVLFKPVLSKSQLFKKFLVIVPYFTEFRTFLLNVPLYVLLKVKYRLPIKLYHILDFQDLT